jgi:transposase InsO family protein
VTITAIHQMSRGSYGSPRVHAELRPGRGLRCGRKRLAPLISAAGLAGAYRRRAKGRTVLGPGGVPAPDLVNRKFTATGPDRLWLPDSFFGSMQIELLDQKTWPTRQELTAAIFDWIEAWYNPACRHSALAYHSPITYERMHQMLPATAA